MTHSNRSLLCSGRAIPDELPFEDMAPFLASANSGATAHSYRSGLRAFADWLQTHGPYSLDDAWPLSPAKLTTADVLGFQHWLMANRANSTAALYVGSVMAYLVHLEDMDRFPAGVQLRKLQRRRRQIKRNQAITVANKDEARQGIPDIVAYYDRPLPDGGGYNRRLVALRNRAFVKVLLSSACRLSEALSLNRSQMELGNGVIAATAMIVGKGAKPRTIHLLPYAQEALRDYLAARTDNSPALFISHSRNSAGHRLSKAGASLIIKRAVEALGLDPSLSAHDFRHFRATQLLRNGMPLPAIQELLGHEDIGTTRAIYAPVLGTQIVRDWLTRLDQEYHGDKATATA